MINQKNNSLIKTSIIPDGILRLVLSNPDNHNILSEEVKVLVK